LLPFCLFDESRGSALGHNEFDDSNHPFSRKVLEDFNDLSRWANYGFLALLGVVVKCLYFALLAARKPRFDTTL
jgi:hypothetical protein